MMSLKRQITWYTRLQWTLAATMVVIATTFYTLAYRPGMARRQSLDERIATNTRELTVNQGQTTILNTVAKDVERLRTRLGAFKVLPAQQDLGPFIRDIAQLGQQASLKRLEQRQGVPTRIGRLCQLPVTLNFEGDFVNVYSFLRHIEELERLTRIPSISVKSKDKSGQVSVKLTMNLYFAAE